MTEQGVQAGTSEARMEVSNDSCNAESVVVPAALITYNMFEGQKRPVPEITFSGEEKDWTSCKTIIMLSAKNNTVTIMLNRDIMKVRATRPMKIAHTLYTP